MNSTKILAAALSNNFVSALASFLVLAMYGLCSGGTRRKKSLIQRRIQKCHHIKTLQLQNLT
ncbi:hypothetical protein, partial [Providencia sp. NPDC089923]|uniref:hypothetical protein n=1 Tax=Providencia sp. NPDC089923 TaxID=3415004 RepID=UPI003C2F14CE